MELVSNIRGMNTPETSPKDTHQIYNTIATLLRFYGEQISGPRAFASLNFFDKRSIAHTSIFPYIQNFTETQWRGMCASAACLEVVPSREESIELKLQLLRMTSLAPGQVEKILQN